jgi:hypothetical protein
MKEALLIVWRLVREQAWPVLKPFVTGWTEPAKRVCTALAIEYMLQVRSVDGWTNLERREWVAEQIRRADAENNFRESTIYAAIEVAFKVIEAYGAVGASSHAMDLASSAPSIASTIRDYSSRTAPIKPEFGEMMQWSFYATERKGRY